MTGAAARGRRVALGLVAAAPLGAALAACVKIDAAPGGIASVRIDSTPAAIAAGDVLRDADGIPVPVRGIAFAENGDRIATAPVVYTYVPVTRAPGAIDTALVVDSTTGAVRATRTFIAARGYVAARFGGTLQLLDTLEIVPRPTALQVDTIASVGAGQSTDVLYFSCADTTTQRTVRSRTPGDSTAVNTYAPLAVQVLGDSAGKPLPSRRWLVRWRIQADSVDAPAARYLTTPHRTARGDTVTPLAILASGIDRRLRVDTADANGTSTVRFGIAPLLLGSDSLRAMSFRAIITASVARGPSADSALMRTFHVRLSRRAGAPCS